MKLKKGLMQTLIIVAALVGIMTISTTSQASLVSTGSEKLLKITNPTYRPVYYNGTRTDNIYSYTAGLVSDSGTKEQSMWKIYEYNSNGTTVKNYNNALYCLKMGSGFGSINGSATEPRTYNKYADMKQPITADQTIIDDYINGLTAETDYTKAQKYNSLIWVLDHCYVPAPSSSPTTEETQIATTYRAELLKNAGIENSIINDDLIDIVQQIAIWHFTNNDQYKANEISTIRVTVNGQPTSASLTDQFGTNLNGTTLDSDVDKLFNYFVQGGEANKNTPASTTATNPVQLISTNAKATSDGSYYIAGPYKIEEVSNIDYILTATLKAENGTDISYTLLDSNKVATTNTLKDMVGEDFYLKIPASANIEKAKFKVTATTLQNTITYWTINGHENNEQPVAELVKQNKSYDAEVQISLSNFDLSLRKFITNINNNELLTTEGKYTREPSIDLTPLVQNTDTTAIYKHQKDPIGVSVGDIVIYTLRIYNEGNVDGYASSVTDYLPAQLEFINDEFNAGYGWIIDSTGRKATTTKLARTDIDPQDNLIKAFNGTTLDYQELKIKCKVVSTDNLNKVITNIADITACTDADGNTIKDRDSEVNNVVLPADVDLPDYKGNASNKSILTDKEYFYKGQEDDDDFEKLILKEFDLALRKFITGVNDTAVTNRIPVFTKVKDTNGNYIYEHTKEPVEVESADIVEYTIRIFNEGDIAGYAKEIKDNIPVELEFLPNNDTNIEYRWKMLDADGNETTDVSDAKYITTDYLSKEQEKTAGANLITAFDGNSPAYKDVKVAFKVIAPNGYEGIIKNIAEISDDSDEYGKEVTDVDSTPNNNKETEDDIDVEYLKLTYFDLALRKFITEVTNTVKATKTNYPDRIPVFSIDDDGNYIYTHSKEPVDVENGNIVTYTLRIYNEGTKAGYAKEVKDDLPEGLLFLPDNELNKEYRWVMLDENDETTDDITKAVSIVTDYLSKEQEDATGRNNLLLPFDQNTMKEPDYRDIKIAFKVTEPNTSSRILINKAQISDDSDKNGKDVVDKDSIPNKWNEGEDDQDIEKVKVKYFDLALRKWVTQAIVIENGKETVTETGHHAEDDPEEVVKVELKEKTYNKVVVKFRYKIRITNEGEIAGYCTEISDYIPEGLKFVQADNPEWKEVDGKIVTDQLKDTLLQPGDTAEVEVLLTWINGKDNFGLKINVAEISKDKNDSDTPDIDSTPNNKKPGEDDIDDAPVILTVKTGAANNIETVGIVAISLVIISTGVILIKKFVL